jgi:FixJ family two-component response regulator
VRTRSCTLGFCFGRSIPRQLRFGGATCLVLDMQLAGMSGLEVQRRLATSGSKFPIIFVTAFDNEATRIRAIEAGCPAYLRKPFSAQLLFDALDKAAG